MCISGRFKKCILDTKSGINVQLYTVYIQHKGKLKQNQLGFHFWRQGGWLNMENERTSKTKYSHTVSESVFEEVRAQFNSKAGFTEKSIT